MVPLRDEGFEHALDWLEPFPSLGRVSLRHALLQKRPGLWGDRGVRPSSVLWIGEADGRREAFAAGEPASALNWLLRQPGPLNLVAPEQWVWEIEVSLAEFERASIVTRRFRPSDLDSKSRSRSWPDCPNRPLATQLTVSDRAQFLAVAPTWALRAWPRYEQMVGLGAAFGVRVGTGLGSIAWIDASDGRYETLGVFTLSRYRRLGLGRAVAQALIRHVLTERRAIPLWASDATNVSSLGLASSLGLLAAVHEPLIRSSLEAATN